MISDEQFASFEQNGGDFPGQPSRSGHNHIDYSGGSLGMGLSYAAGRAWTSRASKVFVILGDGERYLSVL
jgi:transketolase